VEIVTRPLDFEQRESLKVLVMVRWLVLAALLLVVDYPFHSDPRGSLIIGALIGVAVAGGAGFHWWLVSGRPIPLWAPLSIALFDATAITAAIGAIDGFDNTSYVLYYPALMAFGALFPGRIALTYAAGIIGVYGLLSVFAYERFDTSTSADWHDLGLRLTTMATTVLLAYLIVRVERRRRMRAVQAEALRQQEVFGLEERAREQLERAVEEERLRLVRDVHDGVSQGVYMLSLGLEGAAHQLASGGDADGAAGQRIEALVRLSKQTLLEARGLLFDLSDVMRGETSLDALLQHQVDEFRAITGIAASLAVRGESRVLPATTVAEVYRVTQECFANVFRHAQATSVRLELCETGAGTVLRIADDGRGFDPGEGEGRGHGLRGMRERARQIGGRLEVESCAGGGGAAVTLTIPLEEVSDATHPRAAG
jgi:signal transduction histidine kinase